MNEPKCCPAHLHGELTPEFLAHLPTCEACKRVLRYLNDESTKLMRKLEKATLLLIIADLQQPPQQGQK
jgi:hypothetical protein